MIKIVLVAVLGVVLLQLTGLLPPSSVGGPMTLLMLFLLASLAVGIHEAWSKQRGAGGWIVNVFVALIGGMVAASIGGLASEEILPSLNLNGSLASSGHPVVYVFLAGVMGLTLLGAWSAIWLVNRVR